MGLILLIILILILLGTIPTWPHSRTSFSPAPQAPLARLDLRERN
jgi:hypothetical protein